MGPPSTISLAAESLSPKKPEQLAIRTGRRTSLIAVTGSKSYKNLMGFN